MAETFRPRGPLCEPNMLLPHKHAPEKASCPPLDSNLGGFGQGKAFTDGGWPLGQDLVVPSPLEAY